METAPPRVAAVTGAARGIGAAIARGLTVAGYSVALGDIDGDAATDLADRLGGLSVRADVSKLAEMEAFVQRVEDQLGPVDVFVNNAGVMTVGPFLDQDEAVIRRQFEVNVFGVINGMKVMLPRMHDRGHGHIVNIASASALVGVPGLSTYSAGKHAVFGLSEAVRAELRGTAIQVTVVLPGHVRTELAAGTRAARGMGWIDPEQVADAVVRAVQHPRFAVYVPRRLGFTLKFAAALPRPLRDGMALLSGTHKVAQRHDAAVRQHYEEELAAQAHQKP
jgi:short-subunit dehydrogenase